MGIEEESVTYQAMLREGLAKGREIGRTKEARRILLLIGTDAYGKPDAATNAAVKAITNRTDLETLIFQVWSTKGWHELLQKQRLRRRRLKRR